MGIVVVGAGQAGQSLVSKLRALGYTGDLTLIGDEPVPPYQRPPLSKAYLLGDMPLERLFLRPESYYAEQNIRLVIGCQVSAIDRATRVIRTDKGDFAYEQLALTTGATPRRLPAAIGGALAGIYTVRTLADVDQMKGEFVAGRRLLVVGGGYIGLEAASVAAKLGLQVTLIEATPRILQRVAAPETSAYFRVLHGAHGVTILEGTGLERFVGEGHVTAARLADGREIPVDFVIVGVGITPNIGLAEQAGLEIENGIKTNGLGQTSDPLIWAAGDCASFALGEARMRLESVGNAIDMGEMVAANMLGAATPYLPKPWFWSDQYDCKLQIAGLSTGYDQIVTRKGEGEAISFWYYRGDQLLAVDAMNDARAYMVGKRLIESGKSPAQSLISDPATDLKVLLKG
jgi:3-phenylpropionate/trans-cinnamate dioxygenase ferredoxin reductase component